MATTIKGEIGPRFEAILSEVAVELGYDELNQARKNPSVVSTTLDRCNGESLHSASLAGVIANIIALRDAS